MSFVSKWAAQMCTVPARVYFVAAVFSLSAVYVSQEAGMVSAQMAPPLGDAQMMGPPPGGSQPGGPMGGPMHGDQFGGPRDDRQMDPNQGPGNFGQDPSRFDGSRGDNKFGPPMGDKQQNMGPMGPNQGPQQFGRPMQPGNFGPQGKDSFQQGPQQDFGGEGQRPMGQKQDRSEGGDEDFEAQEAKMEAQRQAQMEKQFAQTKKQFSQMGRMLNSVAKRIATVEKQGVKAPAELTEALSSAKSALAVILKAKSFEDDGVQEAMSTLQESGDVMREGMQQLEMLSQMPKMFKQAAYEIRKLESSLARTEKSAAKLKIDVSGPLGEFRDAVAKIKTGYSNAQSLAASGDADGAVEALRSEVWDNLQDTYQYPAMIQALSNVKKYVSTFDRFIVKAARNKAVLADSEASASLQEMRSLVAELKAIKKPDPEELHALVNEIFELQSQVQDVLGATTQSMPQLKQGGNQSFDFSAFSQLGGTQGQ